MKYSVKQPRSQGFSLFVIGKAGKGPGTGRSHDFQHPDIVGVINIIITRKYMHAETLALLTKPLYFPNMKF
jgi:hypothetical protein